MAKKKNSEIVYIKVKANKRQEHENHAGMWKVAYADFITAMMCFFLVMWLVSTTPTEKLEGIAKYFSTKSSRFTGTGKVDGKERAIAPKSQPKQLLQSSLGEQVFDSTKDGALDAEETSFVNTMNDIRKDRVMQEFSENIIWDVSSDGLRIQITDSNNRPMFRPNTAQLAPYMMDILDVVSRIISGYPNYVAISGHTASAKSNDIIAKDIDFFRLSALRANSVRKYLSDSLKDGQVVRIVGKSDNEPLDPKEPFNSKNARISITLLSNTSISKYQQSLPTNAFK